MVLRLKMKILTLAKKMLSLERVSKEEQNGANFSKLDGVGVACQPVAAQRAPRELVVHVELALGRVGGGEREGEQQQRMKATKNKRLVMYSVYINSGHSSFWWPVDSIIIIILLTMRYSTGDSDNSSWSAACWLYTPIR